jgi:hypothetical protein
MNLLIILLIIIIVIILLLFTQVKETFEIRHIHSNDPRASSHTRGTTKYAMNVDDNVFYWDKYHNDEYGDLIVYAESATDSHKKNFNLTPLKWNPKYKEPNWITNI